MNAALELVIVSAILIQYFFIAFSLFNNKKTLFACTYVFSLFSYDYLFINASYFLPSIILNILKPITEYIFIGLVVYFIKNLNKKSIKINNVDKSVFIYLFLPSLIILVIDDLSGKIDILGTVQGLRIYIIPIIVPYLMQRAQILKDIKYKAIIKTMFFLSISTVAYGIYQKFTFSGNVQSLWFYKFFNQYKENPIDIAPYNYIRNDILRTTSFFVSPIIYSITLALTTILCFSLLLNKRKEYPRLIILLLIPIFIYGLIIAETRIGIFVSVIGLIILLVIKLSKNKISFFLLLLIPIAITILTFVTLVYNFTDDLSALGRIVQYYSFFDLFKLKGLGFNNENVLTRFDTFFLSLSLLYGLLAFLPLLFFYKINRFLYTISTYNNNYFFLAVLSISLTFIYSFAFQFSAGSYPYRVVYFLIFIVFSNYNNDKQINYNRFV